MKKEDIQENSFACRECGVYWSEESNADENFVCEECYGQLEDITKQASPIAVLENIKESKNPNSFLISDIEIEDKEECALWCGMWFEKMKPEFLDCGHINESYEGFLVQTYVSTKESMPESIQADLEAHEK